MSRTEAAPAVLVTRPLPQAGRTAAALAALGYRPILAPLLRIDPVAPPEPLDMAGVQAVLATSANGIERLAEITTARTVPVLAVGTRTAEAARACGFADVRAGQGSAAALFPAIRALDPLAGALLHPRGVDAAISFAPLAAEGFALREAILYRAVQSTSLPPEAAAARAALIYSARTAEALAALLPPHPLTVIGISPASLAPLQGRPSLTLIAAPAPTEAAILSALTAAIPPAAKN